MKVLLSKVRETLRKKQTRKKLSRFISVFSAVVVFVTTYALILPAITLELKASCGVEEHQHSSECYEERLICGQKEGDGHHHDDRCYEVRTELDCEIEEHQHSVDNGCYDAEENLTCEFAEHTHGEPCYREVMTLVCGEEGSDGHHHSSACYEKVLVCGKEVHIHCEKCYKEDDSAAYEDEASSAQSDESQDDTASETQDTVSDETVASAEVDAVLEPYVPELDPLNMEAVFDHDLDFYYFHAEEGEEVPADSADISDWKQVEKETDLVSTDLVKLYLAYSISAGSLNGTNPIAKYRLPENIHLTDDQINAINKNENGITAGLSKSDPEYLKYLGAEAVEGDRTPDELLEEGVQEYISAVIRVENVYEGSSFLGQDLIFTFAPYTVEKNQNTSETSTLYKVVYQNDAESQTIRILKTSQDAGTPLGEAKFDLYTQEAYTVSPQGQPLKRDLISSSESETKGQIELGSLPVGIYYLVETEAPDGYNLRMEPVIITVSKTSVTYDEGTNLSQSGGISQIGDVYQLKVTNNEGASLPNTGGHGTRPFTILGTMLIAGAGLLIWRKRRAI